MTNKTWQYFKCHKTLLLSKTLPATTRTLKYKWQALKTEAVQSAHAKICSDLAKFKLQEEKEVYSETDSYYLYYLTIQVLQLE